MYRCEVCTTPTQPGQHKLIQGRMAVCPDCNDRIEKGVPVRGMLIFFKDKHKAITEAPPYRLGVPRPKYTVLPTVPEHLRQTNTKPPKQKTKKPSTKKQRKQEKLKVDLSSVVKLRDLKG